MRAPVVPTLLTGPLTVTRIAAEGEGEVRNAVVGSPVRKMARADSDVEPMEPRLLPARTLEARPPDAVAAPPARYRGELRESQALRLNTGARWGGVNPKPGIAPVFSAAFPMRASRRPESPRNRTCYQCGLNALGTCAIRRRCARPIRPRTFRRTRRRSRKSRRLRRRARADHALRGAYHRRCGRRWCWRYCWPH